jgi:folate-binding protein YgfZ
MGEIYLARNDRFGATGYDVFVPIELQRESAERFKRAGARPVSIDSAEIVRIENGIPRFGVDMDENNLAPETGIQSRAISYSKGCYIGQEVIARIRTYGQVAKALRLMRIEGEGALPEKGAKLFRDGKEAGYITSSAHSPRFQARVALGYVRKEANALGTRLNLATGGNSAEIVAIPGGD